MTERIKKLAEQAGSTHKQNLGVYQFYSDELEKFAELIVRECADYMYTNYPNSRYEVNYMRKHMGDPDWNKPIGVK
jgi:hypothetical protein